MIRLEKVQKAYNTKWGRRTVIQPTTLTFDRGANTAILGLNGAGKSTMIRLLAGIERPDRGYIRRDVTVSWPLGLTAGFNAHLTGAENLKFICRLYNQDIARVTDFVRDFSELGAYFYEPVESYSSGMRSRLAFGLSMAVDFQLYLIDEGLSAGDARFRKKCRDVFEARRSRSDIILTAHSRNLIREYCTRAVVMDEGRAVPFEDLDAAEEYYMEIVARNA